MNGYKVVCIGVTSALLVSLGAHFAGADEVELPLTTVPETPTRGVSPANAEGGRRLDSRLRLSSAAESAQRGLTAQFEACRQPGWGHVAESLTSEATDDPTGPRLAPSATDAIVNDVAREHLRRHWNGKREELIESLQEVGSDDWVTQEVDKKVAARTERFELDEVERERISDGYDALWSAHAEELAASIADEDWEGVMAQASEIWADEDALLEAHLGGDEHESFLAEEQRDRVTILAIFATLAKLPWDDEMLSL